MPEEKSCQCSNGDQIPLQKRKLIRAYRNFHTLFLNALQTKNVASEYDRTMQYFYNAFWNILQYFFNGRCKCVRIKNYCSEAVSKAVIIRGESLRMYHSIVWVQLINTTWRSKQKRTEQNTIQHNTVPKGSTEMTCEGRMCKIQQEREFSLACKSIRYFTSTISKSSCDEAVRGIPLWFATRG